MPRGCRRHLPDVASAPDDLQAPPQLEPASIGLISVAILVVIAYVVCWQAMKGGATNETTTVGDLFFLPIDLLAVFSTACAARRTRSNAQLFRSWTFVSIAMVGYLMGNVLQTYTEVVRHSTDAPDLADLAFYVFFFVALADVGAKRTVVRRWMFAMDTFTVALGGGALLWYFVAGPSATGLGDSTHEIVYSIAYPLADLILLLAAVRALQRGVQRTALLPVCLLTGGLLFYVIADTLVGHLNLDGVYRWQPNRHAVSMVAALCFVIGGAVQPRTTAPAEVLQPRSSRGSWLPYVAALSTFALLFVVQRHDRFFPDLSIAAIATLIAVVVATRQLLGQHALVDEQEKNEELMGKLRHQAFHDSLTGLPNRPLFYERLDHALTRRRPFALQHAVLMVDLDGFNSVNDSFGHNAGDEMLQAVGARLSSAVRRGDTVARLGGDEFAILLEDVDSEHAAIEIVEHLQRTLGAPIRFADRPISPEAVSASLSPTTNPTHPRSCCASRTRRCTRRSNAARATAFSSRACVPLLPTNVPHWKLICTERWAEGRTARLSTSQSSSLSSGRGDRVRARALDASDKGTLCSRPPSFPWPKGLGLIHEIDDVGAPASLREQRNEVARLNGRSGHR